MSNNKTRFLIQAVATLLITHVVGVSAEYYTVKPGDVLSSIAEKKRTQSGYVLNIEQIMLTLYKLNQEAFIDGDINRLVVSKRLLIPDDPAHYIPISKQEAQQRLRDKNYGQLQFNQDNGVDSGDAAISPGNQEYTQIMQRLNNHQQSIELLKIENAHITRSFKLLERALGRVVLVQGLMTNDLLKVKSRLTDKTHSGSDASLGLDSIKPLADPNILADSAMPAPGNNNADSNAVAVTNVTSAMRPDSAANEIKIKDEVVEAPASQDIKSTNEVKRETVSNDDWLTWVMAGSILLPLVLALMWAIDFRQIRSRRIKEPLDPIESVAIVKATAKEKLATSFDSSRYGAGARSAKHEMDESDSGKLSLDKFAAENGETEETDSELVSVLELLDMCLLFGDYKQARTVALQAMDGYQDSPILSKKIAFIERKLAKA